MRIYFRRQESLKCKLAYPFFIQTHITQRQWLPLVEHVLILQPTELNVLYRAALSVSVVEESMHAMQAVMDLVMPLVEDPILPVFKALRLEAAWQMVGKRLEKLEALVRSEAISIKRTKKLFILTAFNLIISQELQECHKLIMERVRFSL
jgi:hypothetical protein